MSWDLRDAILTGFIAATELLDTFRSHCQTIYEPRLDRAINSSRDCIPPTDYSGTYGISISCLSTCGAPPMPCPTRSTSELCWGYEDLFAPLNMCITESLMSILIKEKVDGLEPPK